MKVTSSTCYVFNREQLLRALEAHTAPMDEPTRARVTSNVLAFLDGDAAKAECLQWTPAPIPIS